MATICSSLSTEQGPAMSAKLPPPIFALADLDDGVLGMELAVGILIRLLHTLDVLDNVQRGNEIGVYLRGIAHQAEEHIALADAGVNDDVPFSCSHVIRLCSCSGFGLCLSTTIMVNVVLKR